VDKEKVVIDTNVLVSALWSENGNSATIIKMIPINVTPIFNDSIFDEYSEVLNRPKFSFSASMREGLLIKLRDYGEIVTPQKSGIPMTDETDRVFYDTAVSSGAILITGNKKDYPNEQFVLTPAEFLQKITQA
jgi:putative PIN family toxin of toxin-antitoxin system